MAYQIPIFQNEADGCIYKLIYSDKYVIVMGKTFWRSRQNIEINLGYFLKNTPQSRREDNLYYPFFNFILYNPGHEFNVDIILVSNNPYQLLKTHFLELRKAKSDSNCLNKYFEPYIPQKTNKKGSGSWINKGYYLNYMNWKRKFANNPIIQ